MKKALKITLIFLLLTNISFAGTMTNPKINTENNSKTHIIIGKSENNSQSGEFHNKTGKINNVTINQSNNSKNYVTIGKSENNQTTGKIYLKNWYIDTKKCYKELGIPYNENKIKITLIDNETIKIDNKTIKVDKCLVKNKGYHE